VLDGIPARGLDDSQPDALVQLGCGSRSPWAVCQTHPQAERWALANLQRQGFTAYLPLHTVIRRDPVTRTMTRKVEAALFTSYVFVQPGTHWAPIAHTLGVSKLLMAGDKPQMCRAGAVEAVQAAVAALRTNMPTRHLHSPGAVCVVRDGVLGGYQAVVIRCTASRVTVAVMLLGQLREIALPLDCVVPAS
jgi:transcription antitermination factor NusG